MKGVITVSVTGSMRPVLKDLETVQKRYVPAATVSALNKTAKHVVVQVKKELAPQLKVPQKAIAKKLFIGKASRRRLDAALFLKPSPLNPWTAGPARARRAAREAGGWALKPGHKSPLLRWHGTLRGGETFPTGLVLRRQGTERYPTEKVGLQLTGAHAMIMRHIQASEPFFAKTFSHELQYRIDRAKGKL